MREWQSQSHVRWYCRYHVVWVPKYRKRAIFGEMRRGVGRIVRELCQRHGVELVEGHADIRPTVHPKMKEGELVLIKYAQRPRPIYPKGFSPRSGRSHPTEHGACHCSLQQQLEVV